MRTAVPTFIFYFAISIQNPFLSIGQRSGGFVIKGRVEGLENGMNVYLATITTLGYTKKKDTVAKAVSDKKGNFIFKGEVQNGINTYILILDSRLSRYPSNAFHLTNEHVKVGAFIEDWPYIKIAGNTANNEYKQALKDINYAELTSMFRKAPVGFTREQWENLKINYQNSMIVPLILKSLVQYGLVDPEEVLKYFNSLSGRIKNNTYGKLVGDYIKQIERFTAAAKVIKPGEVIPDFRIITTSGKSLSVLEESKKNKYTLIDFWASWCGPCRTEVPNLKSVYKEFSGKGFGIIGVSTDKVEAAWKKAMQEDETAWLHGRDTTFKSSETFCITSIPSLMLLDSDGKLVAYQGGSGFIKNFGHQLIGETLRDTLEELLK